MKTKFNGLLTLLLALVVQISFAQEKTVTGKVSDVSGPLPGVTVIVKGTNSGTQTDFDGNYSINAATGAVLQFSYIGMQTTEKTVGASNLINVTMQESAQALKEVVVTAFGIKRNPKSLGYAVSNVASDEVLENSEPDLVRSLGGKVAGVNVNFSTGVAGASNQINIRGATTFGSASQPLIIVDGIAYDNSQVSTSSQTTGGGGYESGLGSLDPNDIAKINVLKSTAAAALYGSRAANGVIVITTKSGSSNNAGGKVKVNVNSGTYFENIANLPEYQNTYGNGVNFEYVNANGSWGPRFDSQETIPTWGNLLDAFPELGPTQPYVAQPDNVKNLFQTGVTTDNSVNVTLGGEKANFSVTISKLDQEGYIPFNTYDRLSGAFGGNFKINDKFTVGASVSASATDQVGGFFGENQYAGSSSSFARTLWLGRTWNTNLPYTHPETGASVIPNGGWDDPRWSWEHDQILTSTKREVANFNASYVFNDHISASYRVGMNNYYLDRLEIRDLGSRSDNGLGAVTSDIYSNKDIESTLLVNFDYNLAEGLDLKAIIGSNVLQNTTNRHSIIGNTFKEPGIFTIANQTNIQVPVPAYARSRTAGVLAEIGLSYKDYLFLNATGRNDWSSSLPKNNNSYFYPSVSTSVIFTDAFNLNSDVLTFGKFRAGYASVARSAPAEFLNKTFAVGQTWAGQNRIGNRTSLGDTDLTPEFTKEIEVGVDLEFWQRRVVVDFSWYKKNTTDLISQVTVPSSSGFAAYNTNIGEMQNKGIEIGLTLVPVQTDDFKWSLFTTFTQNKNEVLELIEGLDRISFNANEVPHAIVGQPFGVFYGSQFARDANGAYLINQSGGGIVQDLENGIIGDPNPDFKMSFINTLTYKNWSLKGQFDWREGGDVQSTSMAALLGRGVTKDTEDREHTFIIPGYYGDGNGQPILDSSGNQIPNTTQLSMNELYFSPAGGNTFGINSVDEATVYDGTVYRLRELSLAYKFPSKWIEKTPFTSASITAVANNLWYFAPNVPEYTNFDPEVTSFGSTRLQGVEISAAPTAKRYGFKVNLTF
ncbi:SusC/RagA family TonB-linked outer membrane protein [uncultured Lutibacter sp.]|uniref:SusC/RagA family TonB-linked outer membrane protein n=1 Tax=uncultured Lutibacter sp. TaxID=437739 RepID=UPI00263666F6|nr:SusC/RagA family TonB-linked outer membrane protein [uncultured Lutibacter sp.]